METAIEILLIVLPIAIVGGIALFVIKRLKNKQERGTLGKKKSKDAQSLLDSLIPLGMLFGSAIGLVFSNLFQITVGTAISLGAGIGLLLGYIAYEIYSRQEEKDK
ncbi:hypothetical protein QOZ98_000064 [Planomicrobium stackebrandtii]|uniref:Preprotein translocase subunit YajC n=1 Tax=Planomicrobium stackebrandtii TaxID=253160 RepID=A0ABU0GQI5_9BACL|nr:hypothetical protein [Planomicrobium stackebrandtii]MDQ0427239.1 hypothetical protein [Planomicrobium stackebrandtii]